MSANKQWLIFYIRHPRGEPICLTLTCGECTYFTSKVGDFACVRNQRCRSVCWLLPTGVHIRGHQQKTNSVCLLQLFISYCHLGYNV